MVIPPDKNDEKTTAGTTGRPRNQKDRSGREAALPPLRAGTRLLPLL
jgi:hypothetical protein